MTDSRPLVLVLEPVSSLGLEQLEEAGVELLLASDLDAAGLEQSLARAAAIIIRSGTTVDAAMLDRAPQLRAVARAGVGLDNIDRDEATRRGIAVLNTPGGNATAAAELTMALMLAAARHVAQAHRSLADGAWERHRFVGVELEGRTLGLVGLGRVGAMVARRAQAFGMTVLGHDPYLSEDRAKALGLRKVELDELFAQADIVSLHLPLTDATRHLIDAARIETMKQGAILVNCARGGLVDEAALADALTTRRLAAAAVDVFAAEPPEGSPLLGVEQLIHTPHLGASTHEAKDNVSVAIARGLIDLLLHDNYAAAVNLPFAGADLAELAPWLDLARRLGRMQGHGLSAAPERVELISAGEGGEGDSLPLMAAFLSGLLEVVCGGEVNAVNAQLKAAELGIVVSHGHAPAVSGYPRLLQTRVGQDARGSAVYGSIVGPELPRVVRVEDYWIDLEPVGNWILMHNDDVPGVIGRVGTLMGDMGINISELRLGRSVDPDDHSAISVWRVEAAVAGNVIEALAAIEAISDVRQLALGAARNGSR